MAMERVVAWLLGRGVAESCGFSWQVPERIYRAFLRGHVGRENLVREIRERLRRKQAEHYVQQRIDHAPLDRLALALAGRAGVGSLHVFVTTNWDTIIDRALAPHGHRVWHVNGSIDDGLASRFLTEADTRSRRAPAASAGWRELVRADALVLAGLSLRSALDRELIEALGAAQAQMPAGAAWLIVNHSRVDTLRIAALVRESIPGSSVSAVTMGFSHWIDAGLPGLPERPPLEGCSPPRDKATPESPQHGTADSYSEITAPSLSQRARGA
jgi:hypothetical protein